MAANVAIVDTGLCNIDSISRAAVECGGKVARAVTSDALAGASHIILPGVGAYAAAMANLNASGLADAIRDAARGGIRVLGICLGMQLLADSSTEGTLTKGLGLVPGDVVRLSPGANEAIPHMGWNEVSLVRPVNLFEGVATPCDFYFVHSYHLVPRDNRDTIGKTPYCDGFVSAVMRENIAGVQFHPEKSMKNGLRLIRNFLSA